MLERSRSGLEEGAAWIDLDGGPGLVDWTRRCWRDYRMWKVLAGGRIGWESDPGVELKGVGGRRKQGGGT
jgi:hypothetical protein